MASNCSLHLFNEKSSDLSTSCSPKLGFELPKPSINRLFGECFLISVVVRMVMAIILLLSCENCLEIALTGHRAVISAGVSVCWACAVGSYTNVSGKT